MPVYLSACPRCSGDLYEASDMYGDFLDCFQCGYMPNIIGTNSSKRNSESTSIDRYVEDLWLLNSRVAPISPSSIGHGKNAEALEKRLQDMERYGYVLVSNEGDETAKNGNNYGIASEGRIVVNEYRSLIRRIKEHERSNEDGGTIIGSYELVDEDGKLTLFGEYAIKTSTILSEFVDDIYPTATLSSEVFETVQEEGHEKEQSVLAQRL